MALGSFTNTQNYTMVNDKQSHSIVIIKEQKIKLFKVSNNHTQQPGVHAHEPHVYSEARASQRCVRFTVSHMSDTISTDWRHA